jgi:5-methyltetrahydrofolate--homocysteine methyltransferase
VTRFSGVYGYFPCQRQGRNRLLLEGGAGRVAIDLPRRHGSSLADHFGGSGAAVPLFIVTCGAKVPRLEKRLFAADRYNRYLILHGLAVEMAEALAAAMHGRIRRELGLGPRQGRRFSPGYPAWPDLADQEKLVGLLDAGRIGVSLSEHFQLLPELSVSALVVGHSQPGAGKAP